MSTDSFQEDIIIAGFGGQGVMLMGKLLAHTAMNSNKEVTYMPSYGAEVRGGTANCMVIISDKAIASPLVTEPDTLLVMNKASLNKFGRRIKPGGLLIMNSSLIETTPELDKSIEILAVPADQIAQKLGSGKSSNMVMMGAYLEKHKLLSPDDAADSLPSVLAKRHHKTLPINIEAMQQGAEFAKGCKV